MRRLSTVLYYILNSTATNGTLEDVFDIHEEDLMASRIVNVNHGMDAPQEVCAVYGLPGNSICRWNPVGHNTDNKQSYNDTDTPTLPPLPAKAYNNDTYHLYRLLWSPLYRHTETFFEKEITPNKHHPYKGFTHPFDTIIFGQGIWQVSNFTRSKAVDPKNRTNVDFQKDLLDLLSQHYAHAPNTNVNSKKDNSTSHTQVIWRTIGYSLDTRGGNETRKLNQHAIDYVKKRKQKPQPQNATTSDSQNTATASSSHTVQIADFGSLIEPRAYGNQRIRGDIQSHIGLTGIMACIQMLANLIHLRDYDNNAGGVY